jgi:hypothetical protein
MWIMLITKLGTSVSPPKLSIHWSLPWPDNVRVKLQGSRCLVCNMYLATKRDGTPLKRSLNLTQCNCKGGPTFANKDTHSIYTPLGSEHNWMGARSIQYMGERIRVFPNEFSILSRERMKAYCEESHELIPMKVYGSETTRIDAVLDSDQRFVKDAAMVDGCTEHEGLMVALGMDITIEDAEFPAAGWYKCKETVASSFCSAYEMNE